MQAFRPSAAAEPDDAPVVRHGGDLAGARLRFPDAPLPWVDLSTGLNPVPYPVPPLAAAAWARLPDTDALAGLEAAAARAYGVRPEAAVVAAPGTQALIQLLPRLRPAREVAVLGFGYAEHPAVWRAAGARVTVVDDVALLRRADVAVVVNPNNPDGRQVDPADLADLAGALAARGGLLVVDEAFADVMDPEASLVPRLPAHAVVLRSFGKAYGLAGLRLGFAITMPERAVGLRRGLGPWPVSGPAIAVASRALADEAWLPDAVRRLRGEAARLDGLFAAARLPVIGGTPLFRLVETPLAGDWFERLGRAGLLVRAFAERPHWLRIGLPGDPPAWDRLRAALLG